MYNYVLYISRLVMLQEDLRTHRKSMKRLNDRVVELERMMQSSRLYLEDIAHKLEKSGLFFSL
jgi:hypothetical protein